MPLPRFRSVRRSGALGGLLTVALLASAVPAVAGSPFRIYHELGGRCILLQGPPAGGSLTVIQKRGTTTVKTATAPAVNEAEVCLSALRAGDVVLVKRDGSTLRTSTIPRITLRVDIGTDVISGEAPTGGSYPIGALYAEQHVAGFYWQGSGWDVVPTPTTAGREGFSQDATLAFDMLGGDQGAIDWYSGPSLSGDHYRKHAITPSAIVGLTPSKVSGTAKPGSRVTIRVFKGGTLKGSFTRTADPLDGTFSGTLKLNGKTVGVRPGWKVFHSGFSSATPILVAKVRDFFASDASEGTVMGICFPNGRFLVKRFGSPLAKRDTATDASFLLQGLVGPDPIVGQTWELWCDNGIGGAQVFSAVVQDAP